MHFLDINYHHYTITQDQKSMWILSIYICVESIHHLNIILLTLPNSPVV